MGDQRFSGGEGLGGWEGDAILVFPGVMGVRCYLYYFAGKHQGYHLVRFPLQATLASIAFTSSLLFMCFFQARFHVIPFFVTYHYRPMLEETVTSILVSGERKPHIGILKR